MVQIPTMIQTMGHLLFVHEQASAAAVRTMFPMMIRCHLFFFHDKPSLAAVDPHCLLVGSPAKASSIKWHTATALSLWELKSFFFVAVRCQLTHDLAGHCG